MTSGELTFRKQVYGVLGICPQNCSGNGSTGPTGPTGSTGPTEGGTGDTGATGSSGSSGKRYQTSTTTSLSPIQGGSVTITVGTDLAYVTGKHVVVIQQSNSTNRFEGEVTSYTRATGVLIIGQII